VCVCVCVERAEKYEGEREEHVLFLGSVRLCSFCVSVCACSCVRVRVVEAANSTSVVCDGPVFLGGAQ